MLGHKVGSAAWRFEPCLCGTLDGGAPSPSHVTLQALRDALRQSFVVPVALNAGIFTGEQLWLRARSNDCPGLKGKLFTQDIFAVGEQAPVAIAHFDWVIRENIAKANYHHRSHTIATHPWDTIADQSWDDSFCALEVSELDLRGYLAIRLGTTDLKRINEERQRLIDARKIEPDIELRTPLFLRRGLATFLIAAAAIHLESIGVTEMSWVTATSHAVTALCKFVPYSHRMPPSDILSSDYLPVVVGKFIRIEEGT